MLREVYKNKVGLGIFIYKIDRELCLEVVLGIYMPNYIQTKVL